MNRDRFRELSEECDRKKLKEFFIQYRSRLHELLIKCFMSDPGISQKYSNFVLYTEEGKRRTGVYTTYFGNCLEGSIDEFFNDQEQIGNIRAKQGYTLEDLVGFVRSFGTALWDCIKEYNSLKKSNRKRINFNEVFYIYQLYAASTYLISVSFNQAANNIIVENGKKINMLQQYAADTVSIFDENKIYTQALKHLEKIFLLSGKIFILDGNKEKIISHSHITENAYALPDSILLNIFSEMKLSLKSYAIKSCGDMTLLGEKIEDYPILSIFKPLLGSDNYLLGMLVVHNNGDDFEFPQFQQSLLDQFVFFTGAVISNSRMAYEIAEKRRELGELAGRLISIQEEERKRIAAEIHDTLTQTLTGIGYKAYYCKEIVEKYPDKLKYELDSLINNINYSIRQSRQMINSLRPQVLDGVGVVAALTRLVNEFRESTSIDVEYEWSETIVIKPNIEIDLFRIVQEALNNVRKHSNATKVYVSIAPYGNDKLKLTVADDGVGFNSKKKKMISSGSGLGLLIMRERIDGLRGELKISSHPGKGCLITVIIPLGGS